MWYWIAYFVMFLANPIIVIGLNKKYPDSMNIDKLTEGDRKFYFVVFSIAWPFALFYEYYLLLDYWYLRPK